MKYFKSQYSFKQYEPQKSLKARILKFFKKRNQNINLHNNEIDYKTNPYREQKKSYFILKLLILFFCLISWILLLFFLPYFKVKNFSYSGFKYLTYNEVNQVIMNNLNCFWIYPCDNYFLINTKVIEKELFNKFALNNVKIEKIFPDELLIEINEKNSSLIYDNGLKYFLIDEKGRVIKELGEVAKSERYELPADSQSAEITIIHKPDVNRVKLTYGDHPIIYEIKNDEIKDYVLNEKIIKYASELNNLFLKEKGIDSISYFEFKHASEGLKVYTSNKLYILFDISKNAAEQMNNLKLIIKKENPKTYVDLRFGNRVYWK